MKKYFIFLLIGICFSVEIFADNNFSDIYFNTEMLIDQGLYKNMLSIENNSKELNSMQKMELIREFKEDFTVPLILNIVFPFGIGSFYQGDTTGGVIALIGDITSISLYAVGFVNYYSNLNRYNSYTENPSVYDMFGDSIILFASSAIIGLATGIFKIVRPINYTKKYNNDLFRILGSSSQYSMKVVPGLDLTSSGKMASSLSLVLSY